MQMRDLRTKSAALPKYGIYPFHLVNRFVGCIYSGNNLAGYILFCADASQEKTVTPSRKRTRKDEKEKDAATVSCMADAATSDQIKPATSRRQLETTKEQNDTQLPLFAGNATSKQLFNYLTFHRHKWQQQRQLKVDGR